MKGRIDEEGFLEIQRGERIESQMCPFNTDIIVTAYALGSPDDLKPGGASCGDWCPLFGEPGKKRAPGDIIFIDICQGRTLAFEKLEDRRK